MSLIPIEEFEGTVNGNAVLETLSLIGVTGKIRQYGYTIDISGIQPATPVGYIEDCTDSHEVTISKIAYLGKSKDLDFVKYTNKIDVECKEYKDKIEECRKGNIKLNIQIGSNLNETDSITIDDNGDTWYRHLISFTTTKGNRTDEEYVIHMFHSIADSLLGRNKGV